MGCSHSISRAGQPSRAIPAAAAASKGADSVEVTVEVIGARGLPLAVRKAPVCTVEVDGKPENKRLTSSARGDESNPKWYFTMQLPGYTTGASLHFTVQDHDSRTSLTTTLAPERVLSGFMGELRLKGPGADNAWLQVNVDGVDPTFAQQAAHVVNEIHTAASHAIHETEAAVGTIKDNTVRDVTDVVHDTMELFTDVQRKVGLPLSKMDFEDRGVKVMLNEAFGLPKATTYQCSVEVVGKPETKHATPASWTTEAPRWEHEHHLPGYRLGDSLRFTVYSTGHGEGILGVVTLDESQVRHGFLGDLVLANSKGGAVGTLKLIVDPTDGSIAQQAVHITKEVGVAATKLAVDTEQALVPIGERFVGDMVDVTQDCGKELGVVIEGVETKIAKCTGIFNC